MLAPQGSTWHSVTSFFPRSLLQVQVHFTVLHYDTMSTTNVQAHSKCTVNIQVHKSTYRYTLTSAQKYTQVHKTTYKHTVIHTVYNTTCKYTVVHTVHSSTYNHTKKPTIHTTVQLIRLVLAVHHIVAVHAVWQTGAVVAASEWQAFWARILHCRRQKHNTWHKAHHACWSRGSYCFFFLSQKRQVQRYSQSVMSIPVLFSSRPPGLWMFTYSMWSSCSHFLMY